MIGGFLLQVAALRRGDLSVVQPVISTELVLVFAFIALRDRGRVRSREWIAAIGMVIGLVGFLVLAHPTGGSGHATGMRWEVAAAVIVGLMGGATILAFVPHNEPTSRSRRAAFFAIAAGIGFGFVAAVVKELSTHLHQGATGVLCSWPPYVLLVSGALSMFLATNAFQAGPLAASQPGLTLVDPVVASLLGVFLFGEHLNVAPLALIGEISAVCVIAGSVLALSRSPLIRDARSDEGRAPIGSSHRPFTSPAAQGTGVTPARSRRREVEPRVPT